MRQYFWTTVCEFSVWWSRKGAEHHERWCRCLKPQRLDFFQIVEIVIHRGVGRDQVVGHHYESAFFHEGNVLLDFCVDGGVVFFQNQFVEAADDAQLFTIFLAEFQGIGFPCSRFNRELQIDSGVQPVFLKGTARLLCTVQCVPNLKMHEC